MNKVLIIGGPTASGKSQLAIEAAEYFNGVIINADSQQVYKHIPILTACPSENDKQKVSHRLYEIYEPYESGSVVDWLNLAVEEIRDVWQEGKLPIVVGGTGLYIDNLINGTTPIPETPQNIRKKIAQQMEELGVNEMHRRLNEFDADTAQRLNPNDTTRVRRAFEVYESTGKILSEWHKLPMQKKLPEADFEIWKIIPSQAELDTRCYLRFDKMMQLGALDEAKYIKKLGLSADLPAMRALGLPELIDYLNNKCDLSTAIDMAKLHSRQYAKRQRTWFGNKLEAQKVFDYCYNGDVSIWR